MKQRVFTLLLLVWCVCAMPAAVGADTYNFGWNWDAVNGTVVDIGTTTQGFHGGNAKVRVYHAGEGDVLDSIYLYAKSPSGTHSIAVGLYTLTSDLLNLDDRVLIDTIDGFTTSPGWIGIDVDYSMTAKTWYGFAVCSVTASTTQIFTRSASTAPEYPAVNGHNNEMQTKSGMLPDPWSTFGTSNVRFIELYGVVQQGTISGTRGSVSFVSVTDTTHSTSQTSIVITKPASIANGDVLVAAVCKGDGYDASAIGAPAGWVPIHASMHTTDGNDCAYWVGYKIITNASGEGSTYTWTGDNEEWTGGIMCFRGVDTGNILDCSPKTFFSSAIMVDDSCRSITTRTDSAMVIVFGAHTAVDTGSVTMPSGFTQAWFEKLPSGTSGNATTACGYNVQETKGATGIMVMDYNDDNQGSVGCVSLALRPASTGAATTRSQVMRTLIME